MLGGCAPAPSTPWVWDLPDYLEPPPLPDGVALTLELTELGRHLFFDPRLSGNQTQSCATCHEQTLGFSDGLVLSEGSTGVVLSRNSMSLSNLGWLSSYTWVNPILTTLEAQGLVPLVGDTPPELHAGSDLSRVMDDLRGDDYYREAFPAAFPEMSDPFGIDPIIRALAGYQRTLLALDSPVDHHLQGEGVLTEQEEAGLVLFESEELGCASCHGGPLQTNAAMGLDRDEFFFNTGLYETYPPDAMGLFEITVEPSDFGRFRVPSLRNVAESAPYFHDGSAETLGDVIDHYAAGGRTLTAGPYAGDGSANPYKHELVSGFELESSEREALLAFLAALTDPSYLVDSTISDPFE